MEKQVNLNFHQTFRPEKQYIGSILDVANINKEVNVKEISSMTGIPNGESSGKVEPHILYAKYMGLLDAEKINGKYHLSKTKLGEVVSEEDPGLQELLTVLLCHAMMLRNKNGAEPWCSIFKEILPMYKNGIKKEILLKELEQIFEGKINKKNFAPFSSSYEEFFSEINIVSLEKDVLQLNALPYNKEYIYLYGYILLEYWGELFPTEEEISSNQLSKIGFGKAFGWDDQYEYEVLEHLADKGIIRLNRQLVPYTILKLTDSEQIIDHLYSELC